MSLAEITQQEVKRFEYMGKSFDELLEISMDEFIKMLPSRERRSLTRASYWTPKRKKLLEDIRKQVQEIKAGKKKIKTVRTHLRDMVILPEMVFAKVGVHDGNNFTEMFIRPDMIGHRLGEFTLTTQRVRHGAPGMGATKSSLYIPLK
ncbi:30S ribosomal protein S19 [Candidatus Heimdallarchaeota archaeon]|jgi:small subunit ribosomal protein S19|nr:MAG: 30S ribosomal protein S19 [Candidatus Heimdallarchaeota archaeon]